MREKWIVETKKGDFNGLSAKLKVSPLAVSGERLYKILYTMQSHYGVEFLFCDKRSTGKRILELLGEGNVKG